MKMRSFYVAAVAALIASDAFAADAASDYPAKPVRIIVPFAAGGAADGVTRVVGKKLTEYWGGKQVLLDNRPGVPGVQVAAQSPPDGYTLLMAAGSNMVTGPLTAAKPLYDPQKDFVPISRLVTIVPILTAHPSVGAKNVKELIAAAKAKPGQFNYSSSGMGAPNHLAMELLTTLTGTSMVHVPYKGGAPSLTELVGGQVHLAFNAIPTVLGNLKEGKLVAIGTGGLKRARALPEVPAIAESVPGFQYEIWYALFAPSKVPPAIVAKVSADVQKSLKEADVIQPLLAQGTEPSPTTPDELARYIREDTARWAKIIKERNIKLE